MKWTVSLLLFLSGCAALEPAGGASTVYVPSPYGPGSQPNPMAVELSPQVTPPPQPPVFVNPGLPPPHRLIKGPARVCRAGLAVGIVAGEQADESNNAIVVIDGDGGFSVETWTGPLPRGVASVRPAGTVTIPGFGEVERIHTTAPHGVAYVIRNAPGADFDRWIVRASRLDGGPGDLALLSRISRTGGDLSGCG